MPAITVNSISVFYDTHGDPAAVPLLLIMGLGAQMTRWPDELIAALVDRGYYMIRHDNRDIGLSQKFTDAGLPDMAAVVGALSRGEMPKLPYTLADMADDSAGLLDALGVGSAHIVGASMGGMIAQLLAVRHPEKARSLTSIMSTTGNRALSPAKPEAMAALSARAPDDASEDQVVALGIETARAIGSPGFPAPEQRVRERIAADYRRSFHPTSAARQYAAIVADGDRRSRLAGLSLPTLVIHGADDPLVPVDGGRDTAAAIAGAEPLEIPGMGHDLPVELVDTIADAIARVAR